MNYYLMAMQTEDIGTLIGKYPDFHHAWRAAEEYLEQTGIVTAEDYYTIVEETPDGKLNFRYRGEKIGTKYDAIIDWADNDA